MKRFDNSFYVACFYGSVDGFTVCNWVTEYGGHCRGGWSQSSHYWSNAADHVDMGENGGWCSRCVKDLHENIRQSVHATALD